MVARALGSTDGGAEWHPAIPSAAETASGFDLAIRRGAFVDGSLVARKLGDFPLGVYAAPSYLARFAVPRTPAELAAHTCIGFVRPSSGRVIPWSFVPGPHHYLPEAPYRCSEDLLATIGLARAGIGLIQVYDFLVEDDVERGRLVEVLAGYRGRTRPFSLVYPKGPAQPRAVRALVEHILATRPAAHADPDAARRCGSLSAWSPA